jgi:hypothetical protein
MQLHKFLLGSISLNEMFVWNMERYGETTGPEIFHVKSNITAHEIIDCSSIYCDIKEEVGIKDPENTSIVGQQHDRHVPAGKRNCWKRCFLCSGCRSYIKRTNRSFKQFCKAWTDKDLHIVQKAEFSITCYICNKYT